MDILVKESRGGYTNIIQSRFKIKKKLSGIKKNYMIIKGKLTKKT